MHAVTGTGRLVAGRYRLQGPVGRGAMGIVWRGRDELLHRDVAVKQVQITALTVPSRGATPRTPQPGPGDEAELAYQRTLREARAAARLSHPAVVTVFDVVEEEGSPWIIMEFIDGRSLEQVIAEDGPLPPLHAAELGTRLLDALDTAHAAGVLHRDVKPSNVLIAADGRAVLTDFGIATFAEDPGITQVGMVVGTPGFTAPERVRGGSATPASDLWSLGATLYAAVEGRGPFERPGGSMAIIAGVAAEDAPRAPSAGPLAPVIDALLSRDPARRPDAAGTGAMLADAVAAGTATRPVTADQGYNSLGYNSQGRDRQGRDSMSYSQHILGPGSRALGRLGYLSAGPGSDSAAGAPGSSRTGANGANGANGGPASGRDGASDPTGPGSNNADGAPGPDSGRANGTPESGRDGAGGPGLAGAGAGRPSAFGRAGAPEANGLAAQPELAAAPAAGQRPDPDGAAGAVSPGQREPAAASFLDPPDFARLRMPGPGDELTDGPDSFSPETSVPDAATASPAGTGYHEHTAGLPEFMDPPKDPAGAAGGPAAPAGGSGPGAQPAGPSRSVWARHWRIATAGGAIAAIVVAAVIGLGVYSGSLAAGSPAPDNQAGSSGAGPSATAGAGHSPRPSTGSRPTTGAGGAPVGGPSGGTSPSHSTQPSQSTSPSPSTSPTRPATGHSKSPSPGSGLGQAPAGYQWHIVKAATLGTTAGFAIAAPDGWQMTVTGQTAYLSQPGGHGKVAISLHKWVYAAPMREARNVQKNAKLNDPGYRYGAVRPTDFMGVAAAVSRFSWQPAGRAHRTIVLSELVMLATGSGVQPYQMTLSVGAPYAAAAKPVYEKMLSTFQPLTS